MAFPIHVITTHILPKLPLKSLPRFKCVCKLFKSTISCHEFIKHYLRLSLPSDANRLVIFPGKDEFLLHSYNLDSPEPPIINDLSLPENFNGQIGYVSIIGSCNGLLCITKGCAFTRLFLLLNPFNGRFWEIPYARFQASNAVLNFEFGYVAASDDYKIVSFVDYVDYNDVKMRGVLVYSLKSDSWKWVYIVSRPQDELRSCSSVVLLGNNLLHLVFWGLTWNSKRISCFDIESERWREDVVMPAYYDGYNLFEYEDYLHELGVLDGCLCLTFGNHRESNLDVWVMKEYGNKDSWSRLFSISTWRLSGMISPIAYRRGSKKEVLLMMFYPMRLFWYDISRDTIHIVDFNKFRALPHPRAWICIESLGGDQVDIM